MTQVLKGERLNLKQVLAVGSPSTLLALDEASLARCQVARSDLLNELSSGKTIYGVNVGVGALKHQTFSGVDQDRMNRSLVVAHSMGIRDSVSTNVVRMAMALRLNTLLLGRSGCSIELIHAIKRILNSGVTPVVRGYGSIGCGDIALNGQVGYALTGEGLGQYGDTIAPMRLLLQQANCAPHVMQVKDAISVVSNNSFALAESIELAHRALRSLDVLLIAAVSASVAMNASPTPWQVAGRYGRGHSQAVGRWLSALYQNTPWKQEETVHDPLSIRFLAEIYGSIYDEAQLWIDTIESLTDFLDENPVMVDGAVTTSGGSYVLNLAVRTDSFRIAVAHALRNAYNLCSHMISGRRAGLNVNLVAKGSAMTGFGPFLKVAGALATKGCAESAAVSPLALMLADNLEDEANHLPLSLTKLRLQVEAMEDMSAVMSLMTAQALDITSGARPQPVNALYTLVRRILPFSLYDQPLSEAVEVLRHTLLGEHRDLTGVISGVSLPLRDVF